MDEVTPESEIQRIMFLLQHVRMPIMGTFMASLLVIFLLWHEVESNQILGWAGLVWFISICRLFLGRYFANKIKSNPKIDIATLRKYEKSYAVGSFFSGLSWAWLAWLIQTSWPSESLFLIAFLFAALSISSLAGAIGSFLNYSVFLTPIFVILIYKMAFYDFPIATFFLSVYLIAALLTAWKLHLVFVSRFGYKARNTQLIDNLTLQTEQQQSLLFKLKTTDDFAKNAFDNAGVAMAFINENNKFIHVNHAFCNLTGRMDKTLKGMSAFELTHVEELESGENQFRQLCDGKIPSYELRKPYVCLDDNVIWVKLSLSATRLNNEFKYVILHMEDVSQEYKLTERLTYQAQHDFLTGLPNRYAFDNKLNEIVNEDILKQRQHTLCYIDLDQFKVINDTCGHLAGDELLRQIVFIFQEKMRPSDFLSRIGGDEFSMLLFDCNLEQAETFLLEILVGVRKFQFNWENHKFTIAMSIGTTLIKNNNRTPIELIKQADNACYAAKEAGRNRIHSFREDDALVSQLSTEMRWVSRLEKALTNNEFVIYKQDIIATNNLTSRQHCELLIRIQEADGTIIPPGAFLPAAERYNLAPKLDLWMVENVLKTLNEASEKGHNIAGIYGVNLSGASLGDIYFQDKVLALIEQYQCTEANAFICFEITETAAITNLAAALRFIEALREVGCQFALDDFGSGLSSFTYLKQMPVDYLKIDGEFVKGCIDDRINLSMIKAINEIGHVMGISTIAEYVENKEIHQTLSKIGVDYVQGYWQGAPEAWSI